MIDNIPEEPRANLPVIFKGEYKLLSYLHSSLGEIWRRGVAEIHSKEFSQEDDAPDNLSLRKDHRASNQMGALNPDKKEETQAGYQNYKDYSKDGVVDGKGVNHKSILLKVDDDSDSGIQMGSQARIVVCGLGSPIRKKGRDEGDFIIRQASFKARVVNKGS